jgi:hypothetical protein
MDTYEFHPFADAFPMMTDREHAELVADIKANGLWEQISLYQDKILDGRNRYKALVLAGKNDVGATRFYLFAMSAPERTTDSSRTWCDVRVVPILEVASLFDHPVDAGA